MRELVWERERHGLTTRQDGVKLNGISATSLYSRAPIREVIFDVRVTGGVASVWELDDAFDELRERYPQRSEIIGDSSLEMNFAPLSEPTLSMGQSLVGVRYSSSDEMQQFEARLDGFSFNHVSQQQGDYAGWEEFAGEVAQVLEIYLKQRAPQFVTRLGLRYINQFLLSETPGEPLEVADFFVFRPTWDGETLGDAGGFLMKMAFRQPNEAVLLLSQETAPHEGSNTVLLDIDAFFESLRLPAEDNAEIWRRAQMLRETKNEAFEACLTEKTRSLIR